MPKGFFIFIFDKGKVVKVVFVVIVVVLFSDLRAAFFIFYLIRLTSSPLMQFPPYHLSFEYGQLHRAIFMEHHLLVSWFYLHPTIHGHHTPATV